LLLRIHTEPKSIVLVPFGEFQWRRAPNFALKFYDFSTAGEFAYAWFLIVTTWLVLQCSLRSAATENTACGFLHQCRVLLEKVSWTIHAV
jgi:hypothetical protein